jgi:ubiquinone/menaquinone biosynthesis C-methylase UbiE
MDISFQNIMEQLGNTDVYLVDQMMKGRYQEGDRILDAGCGFSRNIDLFIKAGFSVIGVDHDPEKIHFCREKHPSISDHFILQDLGSLSFDDGFFDHIISSAVFHFSESTAQFKSLFSEHVRVLKSGGTFFIRMTSLFGLPQGTAKSLGKGRYHLPDYGDRFLVTYPLINELKTTYNLSLLDPVKTVNVEDNRAMSVLMFTKK